MGGGINQVPSSTADYFAAHRRNFKNQSGICGEVESAEKTNGRRGAIGIATRRRSSPKFRYRDVGLFWLIRKSIGRSDRYVKTRACASVCGGRDGGSPFPNTRLKSRLRIREGKLRKEANVQPAPKLHIYIKIGKLTYSGKWGQREIAVSLGIRGFSEK